MSDVETASYAASCCTLSNAQKKVLIARFVMIFLWPNSLFITAFGLCSYTESESSSVHVYTYTLNQLLFAH